MSLPLSAAHPTSEWTAHASAAVNANAAAKWLAAAENVLLSAFFGLLVVLPLAEIALRATVGVGIHGVASLVQNLTLIVGMLGAVVAARGNRLLAFSATVLLQGRFATIARMYAAAIAATASALLCIASVQFVAAERIGGVALAYDIPVWLIQSFLPIGFGVIGARLIWNASEQLSGRACAFLLAVALIAIALFAPVDPGYMVPAGLVVLIVGALFGAPLFAVIGGVALLLLWSTGVPLASAAVDHYGLTSNPTLPAIPLFTLAGYFLAESGAPKRLIEVFDALFGRFRGGAAVVTVLACTFFTSFTGASGVTILALGGLTMPLLLASGFERRPALGLITAGGLPGVLLFPALPLILYAIVAKTSIESMFLGGLMPMLLMLAITLAWGLRQHKSAPGVQQTLDRNRVRRALWIAKWELALPAVPISMLLGGLATPVEAAAATALYAFITAAVIHRDVRPYPDVPRIMSECGLLVGGILLILGVALALTNFLVDAQVPEHAVEWVKERIESPWVFLLYLNVLLLAVGCIMDIFSAIVVIAPLVVPIGLAFGVDPVHLGIIFLANLELGYLTPPIGINLFFASYRFDRPMTEVCRSVAPLFLALCGGILAITYIPWLSTGLLKMLH
ncbi:MAG: TRAP transporter large permease subunit [Betaproteobacteria bacterium]|nr:TRAP transporter large permease subunit [Betaproteobacteria bacterium]MDH3437913.1 TRAP transporter large permease subunit [Betaproteobacteria bacterium]